MSHPSHKTVVVVAGPTAVGKTATAIGLARYFGTAVLSCDSRQCYRELLIGVARPSEEELRAVPHYFIASHSIHDNLTAADYEQYALQVLDKLFQQHDRVVVCGGTGLYLRALLDGLHPVPEVDPVIRDGIMKAYQEKGIAWLQAQLLEKDPWFAREGEMQNPQRMMRALEVQLSTGQSLFSFRKGPAAERPFRVIKTALSLPKEKLQERIHKRVGQMVEQGLVEEVRRLLPFRHLNALQTVGYRELFDYLDGSCDWETALRLIEIHTWQYAKRQLTWFRKEPGFHWFTPGDPALLRWVEEQGAAT